MALSLRPYQAQGIDFLADRGRAALFDEPGLGKTMQSLLAMRDLAPMGPVLIVGPGDAIGVWQDEAKLWLDEEASMFAGLGAKADALDHDGIVLTNYHRLAHVLEYDVPWQGIIFDEAQALRNRRTKTLFASLKLAAKHYRDIPMFFLSGSPVVKAAGDLWPLLWLIDRKKYGSYWRFVQKWSIAWQDNFGWHVEGVTNTKAMWAELSQVVLRRTFEDVGIEVPPLVRQRVRLKMTPKQAKAYRDLEAEMMTELPSGGLLLTPTILARETRLRQALVNPRLIGIDDDGAALAAFRDESAEADRGRLAFTPFTEAFQYMEPYLSKLGRPILTIRGGMGPAIQATAKKFVAMSQQGERPILLASVFMGKGWSAAEATHVVNNIGWDWNNTTMIQAERRVRRPPQKLNVFSRYYVHDDTHDLDGLQILSGKKRLADAILDRARKRNRRVLP